ncbi:MAG TPA: hypothetical protein VFK05_36720, partial [Polyangiaceae bacterium]|nr:hypothetical protein [Polyangiaceae bacterium]
TEATPARSDRPRAGVAFGFSSSPTLKVKSMALNPSAAFPGQISTFDPTGYPFGKAQNDVSPGDGQGTPLEAALVNDLFGFQQSLLSAAGLTPSGTPDKVGASQYLDAVKVVSRKSQQLHGALQQFIRTDLGTTGLSLLSPIQQTIGIGAPGNRQKSVLVSGASSGGALFINALLNDGTVPPTGTNTLAGDYPLSAPASDSTGTIFCGIHGGGVVKSVDGGVTPSSVTITGLTTGAQWVGCTASRFLAFERSTQKIYQAASLGGTWTATTLGSIADQITDLMTNGAGVWVMISVAIGGATYAHRSVNDGVTWSSVSISGSANGAGGAWSEELQRFVVLDGLGKLWTSPDGATWTLQKTVAALVGLPFGQNSVAAVGPAIACIANRGANALGKYAQGVAYTLDLGATWNESYFAATTNKPLTNLIAANGRLYATDGAALYQSGVLAAPPSLFTGV